MSEVERPTPNSARTTRFFPLPPAELLDAVDRAVEALPRWSVASRSAEGLAAIRTTRLLRFKDDVTVGTTPQESGTSAEFASASRVGKGDMGQNARNLNELLQELDRQVGRR